MMNFELVTRWRDLHKYWSVRFNAIGAALMSFIVGFPDQITTLWASMPEDFKTYIPQKYLPIIPIVFLVLGIIARNIKQNNVQHQEQNKNEHNG